MERIAVFTAVAAALIVAAVGLRWGTYAAGGSDSSCYALMADAFASGRLQPASALAGRVPWPDAPKTFTPGGFVTSQSNPAASAPVCAPGFSVLLAPLIVIGGPDALFLFTPIAGGLLVWLTFIAGRAMAGPLAGAMGAVLVASSPVTLYQIVQPMNDVTTAALWMATFVALVRRRYSLAGVCCGLALLVRPNLLPLAVVGAFAVGMRDFAGFAIGIRDSDGFAVGIRDWGLGIRNLSRFALAAAPFALIVLWLNAELYGSPVRTGYGELEQLFGVSAVSVNATRYFGWLVETHTPFPLLAFAAPFLVPREKRGDAALAVAFVLATCAIYFFYTPFDEWSYLRFLLPAIALMLVLAGAVTVHAVTYVLAPFVPLKSGTYVVSGFSRTGSVRRTATLARTFIPVAVTAAIAVFCVRAADDRLAFKLKFLEQRYRSAGIVVRDRLPKDAVVLSVWDSGAVRFHGRKEAIAWAGLDPEWLDRSLAWLDAQGHAPYILLESWEEPAFRSRFGNHSDVGKLDWPPKYEIDRVVRIFDPKDRTRYGRGEDVSTEYLWPMRD